MNIAVLLSGGVDSSVVVHLLCEQGYRPSLFYIKIGMDGAEFMDCSAEEDWEMASAVARRLGIRQSLLAQYISGTKKPSEERSRKILNAIHDIGKELIAVSL